MSKTYWSQRIEELANSEKAVPDAVFFTSEAYRNYTETAAKDMITGVCGYLRKCGYSISEMEEDRRVNALAVEMLRNPEITAYTDGYNICIGTNNSLVTSLDSRELRHYAIQGFRVHEVAHILFTDFPTLKNWVGHLNQGIWWPKIPDRASEKDGAELTKRLKKPRFCKPFVSIARNIENALEDGFIEREIQEMYGGLATTELATLDEVQISESVSFGEMLKKKCSPFEAMLNQILLYAKYDIAMDDGIPDEYVQTLEDCVFVIDDVKYERNPKKRLEGVNEICCILYPLVADLIKELEKKPKQNKSSGPKSSKSGSGICMPGQAQGSGNDQSQSQQGNGNSQSQPQAQNQQGSSNSQSQQGNATSDGGADSNSGAGGTENNADVENSIATVTDYYKAEKNPSRKRMLQAYIGLLRKTALSVGITRRFFVVVEFQRTISNDGSKFEMVVADLNAVAANVRSHMEQCGNIFIPALGNPDGNEDAGLHQLFYQLLNRRKSETITFKQHMDPIVDRYFEAEKNGVKTSLQATELIAPDWIDFTHHDYIVIDGKFYTFPVR